MTRRVLRTRGRRRLLLPVKMPGSAGTAMVEGGNLPTGSAGPRGRQTFDEWLAEYAGQGEKEVRGE
jgi:hypothetical protein